jgi:drug/metabolite transporter (DMT)-like permease
LVGDLLCTLAGLFYTAYLVLMARVRTEHSPWTVLGWSTVMTPLPLLLFAMAGGEKIWPTDWTPLLLLALSSQIIGQGLMIYVVGRMSPLVVGLSLLLQPLVGAAIGWIVYAEALGAVDLLGAALIAAALVMVTAAKERPLPS